jgi:hypothetical protein
MYKVRFSNTNKTHYIFIYNLYDFNNNNRFITISEGTKGQSTHYLLGYV